MHYFDTSFITPLLLAEPASSQVEAYAGKLPAGGLFISHWTALELASVVAREVRMKRLNEADARTVLAEFDSLVSDSLNVLAPTVADFGLAREYIERFATGLRGGDALHLAIAANHGAKKILTLDQGFLDAGKLLKLPVTRGIKT
ncbi:MAG: type II toxin-antitoxin system VapC family toxin [Burkholderiales bacterium]